MSKAKFRAKRESYDKPRIFHDSSETYDFKPSKEEREAFRNYRFAQGRLRWVKRLREKWTAQEEREWWERMRKRHAEIMAAVEQDKVLLSLEKAFEQRVKQIRDYYRCEHEKEAEAGDRRRREELAKIMKGINRDTCRLERKELTSRGVVRGRRWNSEDAVLVRTLPVR